LCELSIEATKLALDGPADLVLCPDHPADWDAWDIDRHTMSLGIACRRLRGLASRGKRSPARRAGSADRKKKVTGTSRCAVVRTKFSVYGSILRPESASLSLTDCKNYHEYWICF
jgi:hypothetical protein